MYKKTLAIIALLVFTGGVSAQDRTEADTARWDYHLSVGSSVMTSNGKGNAYLWVTPKVAYRANDRLTLRGGFVAVGSLLGGYELQGNTRSLAPRRRGTQLMGASVGANYQVNDRLTLWATVMHIGGWHEPVWSPFNESFNIGVTALSGGFSYALSDDSMLEMHFHFIHDHYGNDALGILGYPYYGYGIPCHDFYGGPWLY